MTKKEKGKRSTSTRRSTSTSTRTRTRTRNDLWASVDRAGRHTIPPSLRRRFPPLGQTVCLDCRLSVCLVSALPERKRGGMGIRPVEKKHKRLQRYDFHAG